MPNWCITHIYASGLSAEVAELRALHPFDPGTIVPMPVELEAAAVAEEDQAGAEIRERWPRSAGFETMSWLRHDWRVEHWGTKWPPWDVELFLDEPCRLGVCMVSAWSPPEGVLKALSERFSEIDFAVVAHDIDGPYAFAWRYVAGVELDGEAWDGSEAVDAYDDCTAWVGERISALNQEAGTE
jgi:hypothetical protein